MLESILSSVLVRFLNKFVENIDKDQLNVSLWSGKVTLYDLILKSSILDLFLDDSAKESGPSESGGDVGSSNGSGNTFNDRLPVYLHRGLCKSISLNIPYKRLGSQPIVVELGEVMITLRGETEASLRQSSQRLTRSMRRAREAKEKERILEAFENKRRKRRDKKKKAAAELQKRRRANKNKNNNATSSVGAGGERTKTKRSGIFGRLKELVINNFIVKVDAIHIRYEDVEGNAIMGAMVGGVQLVTIDESTNKPGFVDVTKLQKSLKRLTLDSIQLYCDNPSHTASDGRFVASDFFTEIDDWHTWYHRMKQRMRSGSVAQSTVVGPISGSADVVLIFQQYLEALRDEPCVSVKARLEHLMAHLSRTQYLTVMKTAYFMSNWGNMLDMAAARPKAPVHGHTDLWWDYVLQMVREAVRKPHQDRLDAQISKVCQVSYPSLYREVVRGATLTAEQQREYRFITRYMSAEDIMESRLQVYATIAAEMRDRRQEIAETGDAGTGVPASAAARSAAAASPAPPAAEEESSWWQRLWRFGRQKNKEDNFGSDAEGAILAKIAKEYGVSAADADTTEAEAAAALAAQDTLRAKLPPTYKWLDLTFDLPFVRVGIDVEDCNTMALHLYHLRLHGCTYNQERSFQFHLCLQNLTLSNPVSRYYQLEPAERQQLATTRCDAAPYLQHLIEGVVVTSKRERAAHGSGEKRLVVQSLSEQEGVRRTMVACPTLEDLVLPDENDNDGASRHAGGPNAAQPLARPLLNISGSFNPPVELIADTKLDVALRVRLLPLRIVVDPTTLTKAVHFFRLPRGVDVASVWTETTETAVEMGANAQQEIQDAVKSAKGIFASINIFAPIIILPRSLVSSPEESALCVSLGRLRFRTQPLSEAEKKRRMREAASGAEDVVYFSNKAKVDKLFVEMTTVEAAFTKPLSGFCILPEVVIKANVLQRIDSQLTSREAVIVRLLVPKLHAHVSLHQVFLLINMLEAWIAYTRDVNEQVALGAYGTDAVFLWGTFTNLIDPKERQRLRAQKRFAYYRSAATSPAEGDSLLHTARVQEAVQHNIELVMNRKTGNEGSPVAMPTAEDLPEVRVEIFVEDMGVDVYNDERATKQPKADPRFTLAFTSVEFILAKREGFMKIFMVFVGAHISDVLVADQPILLSPYLELNVTIPKGRPSAIGIMTEKDVTLRFGTPFMELLELVMDIVSLIVSTKDFADFYHPSVPITHGNIVMNGKNQVSIAELVEQYVGDSRKERMNTLEYQRSIIQEKAEVEDTRTMDIGFSFYGTTRLLFMNRLQRGKKDFLFATACATGVDAYIKKNKVTLEISGDVQSVNLTMSENSGMLAEHACFLRPTAAPGPAAKKERRSTTATPSSTKGRSVIVKTRPQRAGATGEEREASPSPPPAAPSSTMPTTTTTTTTTVVPHVHFSYHTSRPMMPIFAERDGERVLTNPEELRYTRALKVGLNASTLTMDVHTLMMLKYYFLSGFFVRFTLLADRPLYNGKPRKPPRQGPRVLTSIELTAQNMVVALPLNAYKVHKEQFVANVADFTIRSSLHAAACQSRMNFVMKDVDLCRGGNVHASGQRSMLRQKIDMRVEMRSALDEENNEPMDVAVDLDAMDLRMSPPHLVDLFTVMRHNLMQTGLTPEEQAVPDIPLLVGSPASSLASSLMNPAGSAAAIHASHSGSPQNSNETGLSPQSPSPPQKVSEMVVRFRMPEFIMHFSDPTVAPLAPSFRLSLRELLFAMYLPQQHSIIRWEAMELHHIDKDASHTRTPLVICTKGLLDYCLTITTQQTLMSVLGERVVPPKGKDAVASIGDAEEEPRRPQGSWLSKEYRRKTSISPDSCTNLNMRGAEVLQVPLLQVEFTLQRFTISDQWVHVYDFFCNEAIGNAWRIVEQNTPNYNRQPADVGDDRPLPLRGATPADVAVPPLTSTGFHCIITTPSSRVPLSTADGRVIMEAEITSVLLDALMMPQGNNIIFKVQDVQLTDCLSGLKVLWKERAHRVGFTTAPLGTTAKQDAGFLPSPPPQRESISGSQQFVTAGLHVPKESEMVSLSFKTDPVTFKNQVIVSLGALQVLAAMPILYGLLDFVTSPHQPLSKIASLSVMREQRERIARAAVQLAARGELSYVILWHRPCLYFPDSMEALANTDRHMPIQLGDMRAEFIFNREATTMTTNVNIEDFYIPDVFERSLLTLTRVATQTTENISISLKGTHLLVHSIEMERLVYVTRHNIALPRNSNYYGNLQQPPEGSLVVAPPTTTTTAEVPEAQHAFRKSFSATWHFSDSDVESSDSLTPRSTNSDGTHHMPAILAAPLPLARTLYIEVVNLQVSIYDADDVNTHVARTRWITVHQAPSGSMCMQMASLVMTERFTNEKMIVCHTATVPYSLYAEEIAGIFVETQGAPQTFAQTQTPQTEQPSQPSQPLPTSSRTQVFDEVCKQDTVVHVLSEENDLISPPSLQQFASMDTNDGNGGSSPCSNLNASNNTNINNNNDSSSPDNKSSPRFKPSSCTSTYSEGSPARAEKIAFLYEHTASENVSRVWVPNVCVTVIPRAIGSLVNTLLSIQLNDAEEEEGEEAELDHVIGSTPTSTPATGLPSNGAAQSAPDILMEGSTTLSDALSDTMAPMRMTKGRYDGNPLNDNVPADESLSPSFKDAVSVPPRQRRQTSAPPQCLSTLIVDVERFELRLCSVERHVATCTLERITLDSSSFSDGSGSLHMLLEKVNLRDESSRGTLYPDLIKCWAGETKDVQRAIQLEEELKDDGTSPRPTQKVRDSALVTSVTENLKEFELLQSALKPDTPESVARSTSATGDAWLPPRTSSASTTESWNSPPQASPPVSGGRSSSASARRVPSNPENSVVQLLITTFGEDDMQRSVGPSFPTTLYYMRIIESKVGSLFFTLVPGITQDLMRIFQDAQTYVDTRQSEKAYHYVSSKAAQKAKPDSSQLTKYDIEVKPPTIHVMDSPFSTQGLEFSPGLLKIKSELGQPRHQMGTNTNTSTQLRSGAAAGKRDYKYCEIFKLSAEDISFKVLDTETFKESCRMLIQFQRTVHCAINQDTDETAAKTMPEINNSAFCNTASFFFHEEESQSELTVFIPVVGALLGKLQTIKLMDVIGAFLENSATAESSAAANGGEGGGGGGGGEESEGDASMAMNETISGDKVLVSAARSGVMSVRQHKKKKQKRRKMSAVRIAEAPVMPTRQSMPEENRHNLVVFRLQVSVSFLEMDISEVFRMRFTGAALESISSGSAGRTLTFSLDDFLLQHVGAHVEANSPPINLSAQLNSSTRRRLNASRIDELTDMVVAKALNITNVTPPPVVNYQFKSVATENNVSLQMEQLSLSISPTILFDTREALYIPFCFHALRIPTDPLPVLELFEANTMLASDLTLDAMHVLLTTNRRRCCYHLDLMQHRLVLTGEPSGQIVLSEACELIITNGTIVIPGMYSLSSFVSYAPSTTLVTGTTCVIEKEYQNIPNNTFSFRDMGPPVEALALARRAAAEAAADKEKRDQRGGIEEDEDDDDEDRDEDAATRDASGTNADRSSVSDTRNSFTLSNAAAQLAALHSEAAEGAARVRFTGPKKDKDDDIDDNYVRQTTKRTAGTFNITTMKLSVLSEEIIDLSTSLCTEARGRFAFASENDVMTSRSVALQLFQLRSGTGEEHILLPTNAAFSLAGVNSLSFSVLFDSLELCIRATLIRSFIEFCKDFQAAFLEEATVRRDKPTVQYEDKDMRELLPVVLPGQCEYCNQYGAYLANALGQPGRLCYRCCTGHDSLPATDWRIEVPLVDVVVVGSRGDMEHLYMRRLIFLLDANMDLQLNMKGTVYNLNNAAAVWEPFVEAFELQGSGSVISHHFNLKLDRSDLVISPLNVAILQQMLKDFNSNTALQKQLRNRFRHEAKKRAKNIVNGAPMYASSFFLPGNSAMQDMGTSFAPQSEDSGAISMSFTFNATATNKLLSKSIFDSLLSAGHQTGPLVLDVYARFHVSNYTNAVLLFDEMSLYADGSLLKFSTSKKELVIRRQTPLQEGDKGCVLNLTSPPLYVRTADLVIETNLLVSRVTTTSRHLRRGIKMKIFPLHSSNSVICFQNNLRCTVYIGKDEKILVKSGERYYLSPSEDIHQELRVRPATGLERDVYAVATKENGYFPTIYDALCGVPVTMTSHTTDKNYSKSVVIYVNLKPKSLMAGAPMFVISLDPRYFIRNKLPYQVSITLEKPHAEEAEPVKSKHRKKESESIKRELQTIVVPAGKQNDLNIGMMALHRVHFQLEVQQPQEGATLRESFISKDNIEFQKTSEEDMKPFMIDMKSARGHQMLVRIILAGPYIVITTPFVLLNHTPLPLSIRESDKTGEVAAEDAGVEHNFSALPANMEAPIAACPRDFAHRRDVFFVNVGTGDHVSYAVPFHVMKGGAMLLRHKSCAELYESKEAKEKKMSSRSKSSLHKRKQMAEKEKKKEKKEKKEKEKKKEKYKEKKKDDSDTSVLTTTDETGAPFTDKDIDFVFHFSYAARVTKEGCILVEITPRWVISNYTPNPLYVCGSRYAGINAYEATTAAMATVAARQAVIALDETKEKKERPSVEREERSKSKDGKAANKEKEKATTEESKTVDKNVNATSGKSKKEVKKEKRKKTIKKIDEVLEVVEDDLDAIRQEIIETGAEFSRSHYHLEKTEEAVLVPAGSAVAFFRTPYCDPDMGYHLHVMHSPTSPLYGNPVTLEVVHNVAVMCYGTEEKEEEVVATSLPVPITTDPIKPGTPGDSQRRDSTGGFLTNESFTSSGDDVSEAVQTVYNVSRDCLYDLSVATVEAYTYVVIERFAGPPYILLNRTNYRMEVQDTAPACRGRIMATVEAGCGGELLIDISTSTIIEVLLFDLEDRKVGDNIRFDISKPMSAEEQAGNPQGLKYAINYGAFGKTIVEIMTIEPLMPIAYEMHMYPPTPLDFLLNVPIVTVALVVPNKDILFSTVMDIRLSWRRDELRETFLLSLKEFQFDNQVEMAPVYECCVMTLRHNEETPAIACYLERNILPVKALMHVEELRVDFSPIIVRVSDALLVELTRFVNYLTDLQEYLNQVINVNDDSDARALTQQQTSGTHRPHKNPFASPNEAQLFANSPKSIDFMSTRVVLERFIINPIIVRLWFVRDVSEHDFFRESLQSKDAALFSMMVPSCNDVRIVAPGVASLKRSSRLYILQQWLAQCYIDGLLAQLKGVILQYASSLPLIGAPLKLFSGIGVGSVRFFRDPVTGLTTSKSAFAQGLARGSARFAQGVAGGGLEAFANIFDSGSRLLSAGAGVNETQRRRQNTLTAIATGFKGVVQRPMEGAAQSGAAGFMKGLSQGLFGIIADPLSGILHDVSHVTSALAQVVTNSYVPRTKRLRAIRTFYANGGVAPWRALITVFQYERVSMKKKEFSSQHLLGAGVDGPEWYPCKREDATYGPEHKAVAMNGWVLDRYATSFEGWTFSNRYYGRYTVTFTTEVRTRRKRWAVLVVPLPYSPVATYLRITPGMAVRTNYFSRATTLDFDAAVSRAGSSVEFNEPGVLRADAVSSKKSKKKGGVARLFPHKGRQSTEFYSQEEYSSVDRERRRGRTPGGRAGVDRGTVARTYSQTSFGEESGTHGGSSSSGGEAFSPKLLRDDMQRPQVAMTTHAHVPNSGSSAHRPPSGSAAEKKKRKKDAKDDSASGQEKHSRRHSNAPDYGVAESSSDTESPSPGSTGNDDRPRRTSRGILGPGAGLLYQRDSDWQQGQKGTDNAFKRLQATESSPPTTAGRGHTYAPPLRAEEVSNPTTTTAATSPSKKRNNNNNKDKPVAHPRGNDRVLSQATSTASPSFSAEYTQPPEPVKTIVEVYEFERFIKLLGWSKRHLSLDCPAWQYPNGGRVANRTSIKPPRGYRWMGEWTVARPPGSGTVAAVDGKDGRNNHNNNGADRGGGGGGKADDDGWETVSTSVRKRLWQRQLAQDFRSKK